MLILHSEIYNEKGRLSKELRDQMKTTGWGRLGDAELQCPLVRIARIWDTLCERCPDRANREMRLIQSMALEAAFEDASDKGICAIELRNPIEGLAYDQFPDAHLE